MSRYTFDRYATRHDTGYSVMAVTDRGWAITWYVDPAPGSTTGWVIWKPTPSNEAVYLNPTGSLARRILAVVRRTQERFDNQPVEGVQ